MPGLGLNSPEKALIRKDQVAECSDDVQTTLKVRSSWSNRLQELLQTVCRTLSTLAGSGLTGGIAKESPKCTPSRSKGRTNAHLGSKRLEGILDRIDWPGLVVIAADTDRGRSGGLASPSSKWITGISFAFRLGGLAGRAKDHP
jgi:hypothetical protein